MDFIYNTWWLWLIIFVPLFTYQIRDGRPHALREAVMAISGILLMMSTILHFFPVV